MPLQNIQNGHTNPHDLVVTRQGHSPGVTFPRILGIEATGVVEEAPSGEFTKNQTVVTAMG